MLAVLLIFILFYFYFLPILQWDVESNLEFSLSGFGDAEMLDLDKTDPNQLFFE